MLLKLSTRKRTFATLMIAVRALRLSGQGRHARIGHDVHARREARVGILVHQHAELHIEQPVRARHIFQIGHNPRAPEHRYRRRRTGEPVNRVAIDTSRIAHHLDRELRRDAVWGPRHADTEQSTIQEQRMGAASSCGRLGLFDPSIAAKIGSRPCVARQRSRIDSTDTLMAFAGW